MRIGNLEEREFDGAEFGAELQRVRTLADCDVLNEVPDIVEFLGGNPVIGASLLVATDRDLTRASSGSRDPLASGPLCPQRCRQRVAAREARDR